VQLSSNGVLIVREYCHPEKLFAGEGFMASFHPVLAGRAIVELLVFRFRFLSVAQVAVWGQG
jgi:hypothetical protein